MLTLVIMLTKLELRVPCAILALEQKLGRYSRSRVRINQGLQLKVKLGKI